MKFSIHRTTLAERTDEELVARLKSGESGALDELYRRFAPRLMRYFYRLLWQDRARAQDAVHDVFMKIIQKPERVDAQRTFSTWLYSVAHNHCKNEYRNSAVRKAALNGRDHPAMEAEKGGSAMDHEAFRVALDALLREEGEMVRTMVALRFELEVPIAEIATILDLPEGTVKSKLFYVKKRLAQVLVPYKSII